MSAIWRPQNTIGIRSIATNDFDYNKYNSTYSSADQHAIATRYGLTSPTNTIAWDSTTLGKVAHLEWENNRGKIYAWGTVGTEGRSNYTSCGDNSHWLWNGSTWTTVAACSYSWLGNIYIRNYVKASEASIPLPDNGVYQLGMIPYVDRPSKTLITDGLQIHLDAGDTNSYSGSGNDWYDLSGNNNDFSWANGTNPPAWKLWGGSGGYGPGNPEVPAFYCGGRRCQGPASNSVGITNTSGYTIFLVSMVINYVTSHSFKFYSSNATNNRGILAFHPWTDGIIYFDQGTGLTGDYRMTYSPTVAENLEFHIWTFQRDTNGSTRRIYKDGVIAATDTATASDLNLTTTAIDLGGSNEYGGNASAYNGEINSFLVYNRGLDATEVASVSDYLKQKIGWAA